MNIEEGKKALLDFITSVPKILGELGGFFERMWQNVKTQSIDNLKYDKIDQFTNAIMVILTIGVSIRIGVCLIQMMNTDTPDIYKKRIFNVIFFYAIALSIFGIKNIIVSYFF